jgi:hypothetical protein
VPAAAVRSGDPIGRHHKTEYQRSIGCLGVAGSSRRTALMPRPSRPSRSCLRHWASNKSLTTDQTDRYRYRTLADKIHASVCKEGIDPQRNCFTQAYGVNHMDASLLLLPLVGFLPPSDVRIRNTVAEIERRLLVNGLVLRYETETGIDSLPPGEGAFLACSFWLVDNFILQGRLEDAEELFDRLLGLRNDVGCWPNNTIRSISVSLETFHRHLATWPW